MKNKSSCNDPLQLRDENRKHIFRHYILRYSKSLTEASIKKHGHILFYDEDKNPVEYAYLCPLCMKTLLAVVGTYGVTSGEFNLDHYPPESVGGKQTVLVCKACNEKAGIEYDWSLKDLLEIKSFVQKIPNSAIPSKVVYSGIQGKYSNQLRIGKDGRIEITTSTKKYPLVEQWLQDINEHQEWKVNLSFSEPQEVLTHRALIKAAYLYCFKVWGFEFAFSHTGEMIRKVIGKEEQHGLPHYGVGLHYGVQPPCGLYFIPDHDYNIFMVNLPLTLKQTGIKCTATVIIPGADDTDWGRMNELKESMEENKAVPLTLYRVNENLLQEGNYLPFSYTWKVMLNKFTTHKRPER